MLSGPDDIVPFAMEPGALDVELAHFLIRDLAACGILSAVESARDLQAFGGGGVGDQVDDGFVVAQRLATPIRRDEGEEPVLDLVPLTGTGRKVAD